MEGTAAPEQAEPQGSAAPDGALPTHDFGSQPQAPVASRPLSGYEQMRQALTAQAVTQSTDRGADRETSAADEQPASDASSGTPEPRSDGDGAPVDATTSTATDQPRLSRSQRRALHQANANGSAAQPATADTSAQPDQETDPTQRVERVVADGISRLEALIRGPSPSQSDPSQDASSRAYLATFGDDTEFARRALIATRPSGDVYLTADEAAELERWSVNREVKQQIDGNYQRNLAAVAVQAATTFGIDPQTVLSTPQFGDTYAVFFEAGRRAGASEGTAQVSERLSKLEATNRLLADENEALRARVPASARQVLTGGMSASSRGAALADRQSMTGRDLMRRGMESTSAPRRPGGRA